MARKLAVALAGSLVRDPYLQILTALLSLVVSALATAFVQPYETWWLNLLDTLGLFALIVTQILSIVYFYAETAEYPFMDPMALSIIVTVILFAINAATVLAFVLCLGMEFFSVRKKCIAQRRAVLKVASRAVSDAALADLQSGAAAGDHDPTHFWAYPGSLADVAVPRAPTKLVGSALWLWRDESLGAAVSASEPQLLLLLGKAPGTDVKVTLAPGESYRTMHKGTHELSATETELDDVGGCGSANDSANDAESGGVDAAFAIELVAREQRGVNHQLNPAGNGDAAAAVVAGVAVSIDEGAIARLAAEIAKLRSENAELKLNAERQGAVRELTTVERAGSAAVDVVEEGGAPDAPRAATELGGTPAREGATWTTLVDTNGATYYHNTADGTTAWSAPQALLESGWSAVEGDAAAGGGTFYHNAASGETRWDAPLMANEYRWHSEAVAEC